MSIALNTVVSNEEHRILTLLEHCAGFCDELVVVVDEKSRDATEALARDFGATVIVAPHSPYCEVQRPIAAEHTDADWIIVMDGDELLSDVAIDALTWIPYYFHSARFSRENLVGDRSVSDGLDLHLRYFKKGAVTYGLTPHSWIIPNDENRCYTVETPGWIIHHKSNDEHDRDAIRTLKIRGLVRSGVIPKMGP